MQLQLLALPLLAGVILAHQKRATCDGSIDQGYCCEGSIIKQSGTDGLSAQDLICCKGDPNLGVNVLDSAPHTCTAGTQIPLTEATPFGASATTASSSSADDDSSSGSSSSSDNAAAPAMITAAPLVGAAMAAGQLLLAI